MKPKVSVRKIETYNLPEIRAAVEDFLSSANSARLRYAKKVLIKPNLLGGFAPEKAVTTHPMVLEAVIQYLVEQGKEIWMGDSPGGNNDIKSVWKICGLSDLADKYPVKLINFAQFGVQEIKLGGITLHLSKVIWEADAIINVGKYKTHGLMTYTGAVKNLYGLIPGLVKSVYHKEFPEANSFGHLLAVLYKAVRHRISYNIIDGIVGMDGAGPSAGRPRRFGLLFGSASAVALDCIAAGFMGFKIRNVPYLKEALHDEGIVPSQIEIPLSFQQFRLNNVDRRVALLNSYAMKMMPSGIRHLTHLIFNFHPIITDKCRNCGVCVTVCPVKTIRHDPGCNPVIETGNCIRCLCCHEMCPYHAISIHKSYVAKLIMPDKKKEEA